MKKISIICLSLVLMLTCFISAEENDNRFIDPQDCFSEKAREEYNIHSELLLDEYRVEVFFASTNNVAEDINVFTSEVFDECRSYEHAIIFGANTITHEYAFYTSGYMDEVISSDLINEIITGCNNAIDIFDALEWYLNTLEMHVSKYLTDNGFTPEEVPDNRLLEYVYDEANLLNEQEEISLLAILEEISDHQRCDVVVATFNDFEGDDFVAFVDDFYDYNGFGYGRDRDGIILAISMAGRDLHMSTLGYALYAFTDYGLEAMEYAFIDSLSRGYYFDAFLEYAQKADELLTLAHNGTPLDVPQTEEVHIDFKETLLEFGLGSLILALGIGFGMVMVERSRLKTVHFEHGAYNYEKRLERHIYRRYDRLINRTVHREKIKTSSSSSSSSHRSSGSSSHRSSSGSSHGGRSGKF